MIITTEDVDIRASDDARATLRVHVAAPKASGAYPGVIFYSDIFQITPTMRRACARLAGYGFVVAAPDIYRRLEPAGAAIPFDDAGRTRGLENAAQTTTAEFDADCRATLDYLARHPQVATDARGPQLAAAGFCIGGHLAFRAALEPDVRATVCFYATGLHNGKLGKDANAGSLERASEITGPLLMVFGTSDPHVPPEGRETIAAALARAGVDVTTRLYPAEHAFMRDEGPRYDPESTDLAWRDMIEHFRQAFASRSEHPPGSPAVDDLG